MNWAMEQATGCPWTQCLLYVVADCANPEGICWPSADWMADKSQQSRATVYRRLAEMRDMGLLAIFPRFIDDDGKVFYEARPGRRQSSPEIRLIFSAKVDLPRKRTRRNTDENEDDEGDGVSLQATGGVSQGSDTPVAPERQGPSHCSDSNKNLNLNQEDSPLTPQTGGVSQQSGNVPDSETQSTPGWAHEASWQRLETVWADPVLHQGICRGIWETFTDVERERFIKVIRGYLAWRLKQPKLPNRCNIQKLMRERDAWPGYEKLAGPDPALRTFVAEHSPEHRALMAIAQVGRWSSPLIHFDPEQGGRGLWRQRPLKPDELAMELFGDKPIEQWTTLERGTKPFYAWSDRLFDWTGVRRDEMRVPCLFPPRKDGSFPSPKEDTTGPPADDAA